VLFDEGEEKNLIKKTVSGVRGLKACFFVLLIGALMILSTFTLICVAAPTTMELNLLAEESGALRSDGAMTTVVNAGDTETDEGVQAFLSFDISSIPPGSTITDVIVDFSDYTVYGDPFDGSLGDGYLRGYLHDYGILDGEDYFPDSPSGTIIRYHSPEEMDVPASDMNVAEALQNKLGSSRFQLRLQFQPPDTNNNGIADVVQFQSVTLAVTFEAPVDFSVSASPVSRAVNPGVSTAYTVTLTSFGGFSDSVSLSVDGLPSGVTGIFEPSSTVTPTGTATLTVTTGVSAPIGTYTLTIKGSGGGLTRQTTVTFDINTTPSELDETPPVASAGQDLTVKIGSTVTFSAAGSTDNVGIASYEWDFGDGTSGTGVTASHTYDNVGTYNVTLTVTDAAGNFSTVTIVITAEGAKAAEFPYWILIPIIIALIAVAVIVWFLLKRRKKEKVPKPAKIKMTVDSTEILADGKSTVKITIELLDEKEKPVSALADTEIKLVSSSGKVKPVLKIPKGKRSEQTSLVASKEAGAATVSATAKGLDRAVITVNFREKKRYCMHCGTKMPFTSKRCPECSKSPPAGVDTKACKNCNAVIPAVAKFCAECGASQPKQEE